MRLTPVLGAGISADAAAQLLLLPLRPRRQQPLPTLVAAGVQAYLAWLVYMYTALAVRENVLWLNGSAIR